MAGCARTNPDSRPLSAGRVTGRVSVSGDSLPPADLRSTTLRGLRWTVIARPMTELILLGSMVVLARLISPSEFGRFAVAAIVGDLALIPLAGVGAALVQRPTVRREHLQAGFALALLTGLGLVALTLVAASAIVLPIFGARTAALVRLSTPLCMVVAASTVPSAILQRRLAFRRLSVVDVTNSAVRASASIGMAVAGLKGAALVLGMLAGGLASSGLIWAWAPPPLPRLPKGPTRELWHFGLPASLGAISWIGFRNCDYAIVGARRGAFQAGLYFRAYTLGVEYQKKVSQVMTTVGFPMLSRTQSPSEMAELRGQMVRLLTLVLFPLLVLLAIVAPVLVPWLFGRVWAPAIVPTQILAVGGAATLVIDTTGATLMASGRPTALLGYGCAHFATYAFAVFVTSPLGLTAVALSAAVVHTTFLVVAYALMLRGSLVLALRTLWKDLAPAIVSCSAVVALALPTSLVLSAVRAPTIPYLAGVFAAAATAYLLALRAWFPASLRSLRNFVTRLLPQRPLRGVTQRPAPVSY
jgi:lipopolysaccharide exporter